MEDGKLLRKILSPHWWDLSTLETKIFLTLYWWADPDSGEVSLSISSLSRKVNISTGSVLPCLEKLRLRGLISHSINKNLLLDSYFKILFNKQSDDSACYPEEIQYIPFEIAEKNNSEIPNDTVDRSGRRYNVNKKINDNDTGKRSNKINFKKTVSNVLDARTQTLVTDENLLVHSAISAEFLAKCLNDERNLALYKAYINRYPKSIILKAYQVVIKTPPHRIKKSPGAFFTFLVKKYGTKED